jgi:peroxiredoxin
MRLIFTLLMFASLSYAAEVTTLPVGSPAPDFNLPGVDGKTHKLADFKAARVLVVIFTCNHCPTAQAYEARIKQLHADYKDKGVALVAISPNDPKALRLDELGYTDVSDSFADMKFRAEDHKFEFPYLYDGENQKVSRAYGALATPHVFIFDQERKLRYNGRIDDSDVKEPKSLDAKYAIDALLEGKPVPVNKTRVFGCSTKWSDKRADAEESIKKWNAEPVTLQDIDVAAVAKLVHNSDGEKLRLINVWATYCPSCVAELEALVEINRMYRKRKFEMVTISIDDAQHKQAAHDVLKDAHVAATNYIYSDVNKDKFAAALDEKWEGPLPHTLLVAPGGKVIYRHTGAIDALELKRAIVEFLGRTYASR